MLFRVPTIRVPQLKQLIVNEKIKKHTGRTLRLLDAAYTPREHLVHEHSQWKNFFMELGNTRQFNFEHLPGATYFDIDNASYNRQHPLTSVVTRTAFEEYVQHVGVNKLDPVVVYGRGDYGGMLFAARVWYLLKAFGMEHVAVLEGGLERWKAEGGETMSEQATSPAKRPKTRTFLGLVSYPEIEFLSRLGDWKAGDVREDLHVTFEELMFEQLEEVNMLDCRPKEEFEGTTKSAFLANGAPGAHLPGSINVPLSSVIAPNGELKSGEEILQVLLDAGFDPSKLTYAMGNDGTQAALLGLALEKAGVMWILYDGGLREIARRAPSLISAIGEEKRRE